jgi:L-2-hydroxycarboxylate dehydrogenase (NAD+)
LLLVTIDSYFIGGSFVAIADSVSVNDGVVIDANGLHSAVVEILEGFGATNDEAVCQATMLVEGDLRDQHSHGVRRLPVLVSRMAKGLLVSGADTEQTWVTEAVLRVDGHRGFGPVVAFDAIELIMERANSTGIAFAAVANSNHVGMLAPYIERIASAGQIGIAFTTSEALVHPWGGARAMVGTNPIGIAVPTPTFPLVLDMSTASVSMGKILDFATKRRAIPLGWAVDEKGVPTTDADAASAGAISPFGGAKGYGLGIAFEAMVALLTGTAFGTDVRGTLDSDHVASKGDLFFAISLERLGLSDRLPELQAYLEEVRASHAGAGEIRIPGDRAREIRAHRVANGVELHPDVWQGTQQLLREVRDA